MRPKRTARAVLAGSLALAAAAGAQASEGFCGAPSASFVALGERYFALDAEPREERPRASSAALERSALRRLLRGGDLKGIDGTRTVCFGVDEERSARRRSFTLEQLELVETLGEGMVLTAFEAYRDPPDAPFDTLRVDGIISGEHIVLPPPAAWRPGGVPGSLRASRRYRGRGLVTPLCAPSGGRCAPLVELVLTLRATGRALELEQIRYVNGLASERLRWRLAG